jgi:hemerythrin
MMKQNKPIKRSKAFVQFSKDHHFGLLLVWKIRQDLSEKTDAATITRYVLDFFTDSLQQHFKEEEDWIFSRIPPEDPMRRQAEDEHRKIYDMIASFQERGADESSLREFADFLEAHIRFEERSLFNYLQQKLTEEELEALLLQTGHSHGAGKTQKLFATLP